MASAPDFVQCGTRRLHVTWGRLVGWTVGSLLVVYVGLTAIGAPHEGHREGGWASTLAEHEFGHKRTTQSLVNVPSGPIREFCDKTSDIMSFPPPGGSNMRMRGGRGSVPDPQGVWHFAALNDGVPNVIPAGLPGGPPLHPRGSSSEPDWGYPTQATRDCHWREKTEAAIPFPMCLYDPKKDVHISRAISEGGQWNEFKRRLLEDMLPTAQQAKETGQPRTRFLVLDVGANLGFYTLVAATRGYDVVAVEPAADSIKRMLHTLHRNSIPTIASLEDMQSAHTRRLQDAERESTVARVHSTTETRGMVPERIPAVAVLHNAALDVLGQVGFTFDGGNPGASYVRGVQTADQQDGRNLVDVGPLDGLMDLGVDPRHIQVVKISAEGSDARVLFGMRQLLAEGRPPFIMFVFNDIHVAQRRCDAEHLMLALLEWGWKLWDFGVFRTKPEEVRTFLKNFEHRSLEVLFVEQNQRF